jgi:hypothetical protein
MGFPLGIAEEWELFQCSDSLQHDDFSIEELKHAFYMGALMMLLGCAGSDVAERKGFAEEIDAHLDIHAQSCEACSRARKDGTWVPVVNSLLMEEKNNA